MSKEKKQVLPNQEQVMRIAAQEGARVAMETMKKAADEEKVRVRDRRLHNTDLLLKNYRMWQLMAQNAVYEVDELDEDALELMNCMMRTDNDIIVESIKASAVKTSIMVAHITKMMEIYKTFVDRSAKEEQIRRYNVLHDTYISEQEFALFEIADRHGIHERTVGKDLQAAKQTLSAIMFGVDMLL